MLQSLGNCSTCELIPSWVSQATLWYVFGGTKSGREKPSSSCLASSICPADLLRCLQCFETSCVSICASVVCIVTGEVSK